jgi:hypothetical protein
MEAMLERHQLTAVRMPGAIMVDRAPHEIPDPALPLTQQKRCGVWEDEFDFKAHAIPGLASPTRSRIHHRYAIGAYTPGRHNSHLPGQCAGTRELGSIWWYGFSPWTEAFKARKLHISARRDPFDRKHGFGAQHDATRLELEARWSKLRGAAQPLFADAAPTISALPPQAARAVSLGQA